MFLYHLYFHVLSTTRLHLDAPFIVNVYNNFKCCPSIIDTLAFVFILDIIYVCCLLFVLYLKHVSLLGVYQPQNIVFKNTDVSYVIPVNILLNLIILLYKVTTCCVCSISCISIILFSIIVI